MYTYEQTDKGVDILDPDGIAIATVESVDMAEALLSHLNRGH